MSLHNMWRKYAVDCLHTYFQGLDKNRRSRSDLADRTMSAFVTVLKATFALSATISLLWEGKQCIYIYIYIFM